MKNKKIFVLLILFLSYYQIIAQNTVIIGDTVQLTIDGYKSGQIQWQFSTDSINWTDINGAISNELIYKVVKSGNFRAKVSICPNNIYYSDSKNIHAIPNWKLINDYELVDTIGKYLSSDALGGRSPETKGDALSRAFIVEIFQRIGLMPLPGKDYEDKFVTAQNKHTANIIGIIEGSDSLLKKEIVVISAHFDHLGINNAGQVYNGADDNASGVAGLCLLARNLINQNYKPKRTLLFMTEGAEEPAPYLQGMKCFIQSNTVNNKNIKYGINYDMIGCLRGDSLWLYEANLKNALIKQLSQQNNNNLVLFFSTNTLFNGSTADHMVLAGLGIPCFTFTTGKESVYHTINDDWYKINISGIIKVESFSENIVNVFAN